MIRPCSLPSLPILVWLALCLFSFGGFAMNAEDLLPPEKAFRFSGRIVDGTAKLHWDIADGYYLYRGKFKFASPNPDVRLGDANLPKGEAKHDDFLGDMEIYRDAVDVEVPLTRNGAISAIPLTLTVQGCADAGVCFPPYKQTVDLAWPDAPSDAGASAEDLNRMTQALQDLGLTHRKTSQDDLLAPEDAFRFHAEVAAPDLIRVGWQIADGYYLYRDKIRFELRGGGAALGRFTIPQGQATHDEEFGDVQVFRKTLEFDLPLNRSGDGKTVELRAFFQGCAERGVCYSPMEQNVKLDLPAAGTSVKPDEPTEPEAEHDRIASGLKHDSLLATLASFLGMGVLLAFTPCVFPMIPILSGIIVGHGHKLTSRRSFLLSVTYVVSAALTYAVFGVLAGLFGGNLQAAFQNPWLIGAFSLLFVVLALSMFDVVSLQMPLAIQERLTALSNRQQGGTLIGTAIMGILSALIVGPCVAAPLAGALIYIGQTGNAWLGFLALFALGIGMGVPLLAIGASAGKLLPKAGAWMNTIKAAFGLGLLATAIWLLSRVIPGQVALFLWAALLIVPAIYLNALDPLPHPASGWRKLWKGVGIVMLSYGVLLLIGVAANSTDPLQPLKNLRMAGTASGSPGPALPFKRVASAAELDRELADAAAAGRHVMLDFYADWCISCKEMERDTFADPRVQSALRQTVVLQADVTANSDADAALLKRFNLVGPPATLFFPPGGQERTSARVIGYMDVDDFLRSLTKALR